MSILWDEQKGMDLNSEEILRKLSNALAEYQKETASTSDVSFFIGLASGSDKELLHTLLSLPSETLSQLLKFIQSDISNFEDASGKSTLKNLLLSSPHKDIVIPLIRPTETGREPQGWDIN